MYKRDWNRDPEIFQFPQLRFRSLDLIMEAKMSVSPTRFLGKLDCSLIMAGGAVAEYRALSGSFELQT